MGSRNKEITGVHACYRCGTVNGEIKEIDDDFPIRIFCGECGEENTIVTMTMALDMLNATHYWSKMQTGLSYEDEVDDVDTFLEELRQGKHGDK